MGFGSRSDAPRWGAVAIIYEARPNVTTDAAALCLKSGNACILRGGKEMFHSTQAIGKLIAIALDACGVCATAVQMVATTDRALVPLLLKHDQYIDVVIPRGGESLIRAVVAESTIPVIKHYTGNCHVYIHQDCPLRPGRVSCRQREGPAPRRVQTPPRRC